MTIVVLATPGPVAQHVCAERVAARGRGDPLLRARALQLPDDVVVRSVDVAGELQILAFHAAPARRRARAPRDENGRVRRGSAGLLRAAARGQALDGRDVERDLDLVADEDAAGLERGVPGQAVVLARDLERGLEAGARVAERVGRGAGELGGELDVAGHAVDGEVADDDVVVAVRADARRGEGPDRLLLGVPEVGALEVPVAVLVAGVDRRRVERRR